jgi:hypothetical protein
MVDSRGLLYGILCFNSGYVLSRYGYDRAIVLMIGALIASIGWLLTVHSAGWNERRRIERERQAVKERLSASSRASYWNNGRP